jgi:hypothetical protein
MVWCSVKVQGLYLYDKLKESEMGGACSAHEEVLVGIPERKNYSEDLVIDGTLIYSFGKYSGKVRAGFIWLRIGTSDGLL